MRDFEAKVVREQISGRPGLINRHGTTGLAGSFSTKLKSAGSGFWTIAMSTAKKYTRIHQFGGVIKPVRAKFLTFKIHTSNRIFSKAGVRLKKSPREFSWVRVKQVTIPKRLRIIEDFYASGANMIRAEVTKLLREYTSVK
jgi:hypothetical protein